MGMVGEACLPSNAYYLRTPDYTLCSGVYVCWSEHSDSSFVYGFKILDYGFGTMTTTTYPHTCPDLSLWLTSVAQTTIFRTNLLGPKDERATGVRLYKELLSLAMGRQRKLCSKYTITNNLNRCSIRFSLPNKTNGWVCYLSTHGLGTFPVVAAQFVSLKREIKAHKCQNYNLTVTFSHWA